jgi:hypothetical protein
MNVDASFVAVVLSCAFVNVLLMAVWGLVRILPRGGGGDLEKRPGGESS